MNIIRRLTNPIRWAWQRLTRGWDDRVIWSIDYHLAEMMPQWLRALRVKKQGVPGGMTGERWQGVLDEMIAGFEAARRIIDYPTVNQWEGEDGRLARRALRLLAKYYLSLCD